MKLKRGPFVILDYAGKKWLILKHAHFGEKSLCYDIIFGQSIDYASNDINYIVYLKDRDRDKLIDVLIGRSFIDISDRYFQLLCTYA